MPFASQPKGSNYCVEHCANLLRSYLQDKAALLVLDDVWDSRHVGSFNPGAARRCRLLFTTRDGDIAAVTGAKSQRLDVLDEQQSFVMLTNYAGLTQGELEKQGSRSIAEEIVRECHGLPLALAMVGSLLHEEAALRWADLLDSNLKRADLDEIQLSQRLPNYEHRSITAAIEVSVKALGPDKRHYLDLAVFHEDAAIPEAALQVVWNLDGIDVRRITSLFVKRSASLARLKPEESACMTCNWIISANAPAKVCRNSTENCWNTTDVIVRTGGIPVPMTAIFSIAWLIT